jgi:cell division protein FtsB
MYVNSTSNAFKLEPIVERAKAVKSKRRYRLRNKKKFKCLALIGIVFIIACIICFRYVHIYGQNALIQQKASELQKLDAANTQLALNIQKAIDTKTVEDYATNVLGMKKPDRHQIAYIKASGQDVMEKKEEQKSTTGIFGVISSTFNGVLEYFN